MGLAGGNSTLKILIVGNFRFGSDAANALRVRGVARALRLAGDDVSILDNGASNGDSSGADGTFPLATVDEYRSGSLSFLPAGIRGLLIGDVSVRRVQAEAWKPDCIVLYGPHLGYLLRFRRLCRELSIPLVLDIVEWYQPEDLPGGRFGPYAIANEISMRHLSHQADGVIVLSRRLEQHYKDRGGRVINIPPLFEPEQTPARKASETDGRLHLVYAGTPGRKEAFDLILTALQRLDDQGVDFILHAVGITAADVADRPGAAGLGVCDPARGRIRFYGRVPNARARLIVAQADFTLLLRPPRKANQYGFPSKLAESMAVGTPVIANDFSDLALHLVDGDNAVFLRELNLEVVADAFGRAAAMPLRQRREMADRALTTARDRFSPSSVSAQVSGFLTSVRRGTTR